MTEALIDRLLQVDPRDAGCGPTCAGLEQYVEAEVSGLEAEVLFPGMAVHLGLCPACRLDHDGLRAVIEAG